MTSKKIPRKKVYVKRHYFGDAFFFIKVLLIQKPINSNDSFRLQDVNHKILSCFAIFFYFLLLVVTIP
jgi:hypothetical protein